MRADVEHVQHVELGTAVKVPGADHVCLVHLAGLGCRPVRVGHSLGHITGHPRTWPGEAGAGNFAFYRPAVRHRLDAHPVQLPGHCERPVLGPGVRLEALPCLDDEPGHLGWGATRRAVGGTRAALGPFGVTRPFFIAGHPFAHPAAGAA